MNPREHLRTLVATGILAWGASLHAADRTPAAAACRLSVAYASAPDQGRFKSALVGAEIPFGTLQTEDGRERICWSESSAAKVSAIQTELFGPELPIGRNVRFLGPGQEVFVAWLRERGLPFERVVVQGNEFIVWGVEIDGEVRRFPWLADRAGR